MSKPGLECPLKVGMVSLGCAKNLVDGEIMLGALRQAGFETTSDAVAADAVVVNTCAFIDAAQEESVDAILETAEMRDLTRPGQAVIVAGCLPQRFREELPKLLPEVDAFMGIDQVAKIPEIVREALSRRRQRIEHSVPVQASPSRRRAKAKSRAARLNSRPAEGGSSDAGSSALVEVNPRPRYIPDYATPHFRLTPRHFAYLKIAEGCNHPCSFCTIPQMRGAHRSRLQDDVVREAEQLAARGVKELNLISQDSTFYGLDLRPGRNGSVSAPDNFRAATRALPGGATTLGTLLRALDALEGDFWIRLLYTHPAHWTDELIETIAECPKVARYVDIPLQHIHPAMLERMRRETSREYIEALLESLRARLPGIALRTTFIVGFPGETEEYFQSLLEFIRRTRFERLGVFTYSKESGTRAGAMAHQVPDRIKRKRRDLAMTEQRKITRETCGQQLGRTMRVLVERPVPRGGLALAEVRSSEHGFLRVGPENTALSGEFWTARSQADAPDIDGQVYVRGRVRPGEFATVKIVGHTDYDLIAELA